MRSSIVFLFSLILLSVACSKAPDYVIKESDMADLMADMYKAEAMVEDKNTTFNNDSMRMMARQSVLKKHNITQEKFDTSLIWYAHHLEVYNKVYDDVIEQLDNEFKELSKGDFTSVAVVSGGDIKPSVPRYRSVGDTADIWGRNRTWVLLPGFAQNVITFDMKPDKENIKGDKYELAFKLINMRRSMKVYIGVDYKDGSTSYSYRRVSSDGWKNCPLQSDSTREVKRIYGYMTYDSQDRHAVFVDSVELLRTHLDRSTYTKVMDKQPWIGQKKEESKSEKVADNDKKGSKIEPLDLEPVKNDSIAINRGAMLKTKRLDPKKRPVSAPTKK